MPRSFNTELPFGGRPEYAELTTEDRLLQSGLVADMLDELLESPHVSDGPNPDFHVSNNEEYSHYRSFQYLDVNHASKQTWPLIEKTFDIHYTRTKGKLTNEQYYVSISTRIHQLGVSEDQLYNIYQINFYGSDRSSATGSIQQPNLIGEFEYNYDVRPTTSYDHEKLFTELGQLYDMLQAQALEMTYLERS